MVSPPPGQLFNSGSVGDPLQLDPPSHSLVIHLGVFHHSGGLGAPLSFTHSRGLAGGVNPQASDPLPFHFFASWHPPTPAASASLEVASDVAPPPAV